MIQLLWKQNRFHDCSLSLITDCCLCFFSAGMFGLGQFVFLFFCAHWPISRVSVLVWNLSPAEGANVINTYKPSTFVYGTVCSSLQLIPTGSAPALFIRAITGSKATVDYFWDVSVSNNEISHHIKNMPYNASYHVPSTSSTHFFKMIYF